MAYEAYNGGQEDFALERALKAKRQSERDKKQREDQQRREKFAAEARQAHLIEIGEILHPNVARAYQYAEKNILPKRDYSIHATDFQDIKPQGEIMRDMAKVMERRKQFKASETLIEKNLEIKSKLFEAMFVYMSKHCNLLGQESVAKRTSLVDDILNGIDMYAEAPSSTEGEESLVIGFDVTFSANKVSKKLERYKQNIGEGNLGKISFFQNTLTGINQKDPRYQVPRVVIGTSMKAIEELSTLLVAGKIKELMAHPMQRVIAEEMCDQLLPMCTYAEEIGEKGLAEKLRRVLAAAEKLKEAKKSIPLQGYEHDAVARQIREQSAAIFAGKIAAAA